MMNANEYEMWYELKSGNKTNSGGLSRIEMATSRTTIRAGREHALTPARQSGFDHSIIHI